MVFLPSMAKQTPPVTFSATHHYHMSHDVPTTHSKLKAFLAHHQIIMK